jgi:serine/threonine protein kinase
MRDPIPYGRYLLLERIEIGGMAEVFLARVREGEGAGSLVAVKRLLPTLAEDPELVAMFLDEARIAVQLDHPGVTRIADLGRHGPTYYIAMEYVPGKDLKALLERLSARGERLRVPVAALIAARVLAALEHAHRRRDAQGAELRIVHRDVSPKNVLLSFAGDVKLIDFGLARGRGMPEDHGVVRGTGAYMSPEQARGLPVDASSDVFSAAVVLHEMLTGGRLFAAPTELVTMERVAAKVVPSPRSANSEVPEALASAVLQALERDPALRPPSAEAFAAAVAPHAAGADAAELGRLLATLFPEEARRARERQG